MGIQGFIIFLIAYAFYLLFAYKKDPRFSLKYERVPSFYFLMLISTLETLILVVILIILNLLIGRDLISIFGLNRLNLTGEVPLLGFLGGILVFITCLVAGSLISLLHRKFFFYYKPTREEEVKKLMLASLPRSRRKSFALLTITSLKAAIFEEIIFRGYLLSNLLLLTSPTIALIVQALLFSIPHLYQGILNALLPLIAGLLLGEIFLITDSLTVVIVAHFVGDVIGLIIQVFLPGRE